MQVLNIFLVSSGILSSPSNSLFSTSFNSTFVFSRNIFRYVWAQNTEPPQKVDT